MRSNSNRNLVALFALLMMLCVSTAGCNFSPGAIQKNAELTFQATSKTLLEYRKADIISAEQWTEEIMPVMREADALLDLYSETVDPENKATALEKLEKVLIKLVEIRYSVEAGKKKGLL